MMKSLLALALLLSTNYVRAADLESMLDEADSGAPKVSHKTKGAKPESESPLVFALKKSIGNLKAEQQVFFRYVEANDWEKAVLQFPVAFEGTSFQKSANGRALFGLTQFRAGLPVAGLQTLFIVNNPKEISPYLQEEWRTSATADHFVWDLARIDWRPAWNEVFGTRVEQRVQTAKALKPPLDYNQLAKLSASLPAGPEKSRVDWQIVLNYAMNDKADQAGKVLAGLMKSANPSISKDLMQVTAARLLFQNGYYDAAIKYYEKVPKASEYWTEAQEEIGWAYLRKGEPNNAMAISQSLVTSNLKFQVSPEAYFVRALSQLKVCDYPGTVASLNAFPKTFKERTHELSQLSTDANTAAVQKALDVLKSKKAEVADLGASAQSLPRRLLRDKTLFELAQAQKHLEDEAKVAEQLYAKSLALTGLQGSFESLKQASLQKANMAKNASMQRVKELAKVEVEETKEILRKLHIVEAEVLQQVSVADKVIKNTSAKSAEDKLGTTGSKATAGVVRYPAEDEVWFDELANYRVDIKKACTAKR